MTTVSHRRRRGFTSWRDAFNQPISLLRCWTGLLLLLVSLPTTIILGCKSTIIEPSENPPSIIGSWNWIATWAGGPPITPETLGHTIIREFTKDSMYNVYEDTILTHSTPFSVTRGYIDWLGDTVDIIHFSSIRGPSSPQFAAEFHDRDTLMLHGLNLGGLSSLHSRITR